MSEKHYAHYLTVAQHYNLDLACRPVWMAFARDAGPFQGFGLYMVGSVLRKRDWRDVDVRCILPDERFDELYHLTRRLIEVAVSEWLRDRSGLPVDFQFQQMTAANKEYPSADHPRNAIGMI